RTLPVLVRQLEPLIGDRMQAHILPRAQPLEWPQSQRLSGALRVDGQGAEQFCDFVDAQTALERHCAEMMAMQPPREIGEQRMLGIGRDALDYELVARDPERQC